METIKARGGTQHGDARLRCGHIPLCSLRWNEHGMTLSLLLMLSVWYFRGHENGCIIDFGSNSSLIDTTTDFGCNCLFLVLVDLEETVVDEVRHGTYKK